MSDILVVKVNMFCKPREWNNIRDYILAQRETGVIILPPYCEPDDVKICIEDLSGKTAKGEE